MSNPSSKTIRANNTNTRPIIPTARKRPVPSLPRHKPQPEPINVDTEYERKYEIHSDDVIIPIDISTFRQNVRDRSKSKGKERQRTDPEVNSQGLIEALPKINTTAHAAMSMLPTSSKTNISNFPSQIGPAIAEMRRNRSMAPQQQSASTSTAHKRRKIDSSTPTATATQATGTSQSATTSSSKHTQQEQQQQQQQQQPVPGPSRSHPTSNAVAGPSHHPATQRKRKPVENYDGVDDLEVMVLSDSSPGSMRKRPKIAATPATSGTRPSSASSRVQTPVHKPMSLQTLARAKRLYEVIELSSDDEVDRLSPQKKPKVARPPPPGHPQDSNPIEISSDSEHDFAFDFGVNFDPVDTHILSPVSKPKIKPELHDDDEDDEWIPPGFDLNDPDTWIPLNSDNAFLENTLTNTLEQLNIGDSKAAVGPIPIYYIPPDTSKFDPRPRRRKHVGEPVHIWDKLAQTTNARVPPRPRPAAFQLARPYMPPWKEDFDLYRLKRAFYDPNGFYELKKAPGSINRVVQKGSWTVIASGCLGGLPDEEDEEPNPHNREGSLMTLRHELDIPKGHEVKKFQPPCTKYYAVNDIQFDPLRKAFASTGADCRLRLWSLQDDDEDDEEEDPNNLEQDLPPRRPRWTSRTLKPYKNVPHDLAFKPYSSLLAVAENPEALGAFPLHPVEAPHIVGAMAWGSNPTSTHLFASSEPLDSNSTFEGVHKAYDVQEKKSLYSFDAKEAGDTLCIGPTGSNLALSTRGAGSRPILRLYDIARRDGKATSTVDLEPFLFGTRVLMANPDGLFLALARNDNQTHVYDMRYIHRGPLYRYEHIGECQASDKECLYGIVKAQWIQLCASLGSNLSATDPKNGTAIVQVNSDIGHFSLGDPFAGEHRLVVIQDVMMD
ncbi:hypothetical protein BJ912DRAFT_920642 [Pholiota molesta]|nr:hypothetical protein BJ912DRAFT_920642 [Pholiota molesta]